MNEWPHKTSTTRNESVGENVRVAIIMEKKSLTIGGAFCTPSVIYRSAIFNAYMVGSAFFFVGS